MSNTMLTLHTLRSSFSQHGQSPRVGVLAALVPALLVSACASGDFEARASGDADTDGFLDETTGETDAFDDDFGAAEAGGAGESGDSGESTGADEGEQPEGVCGLEAAIDADLGEAEFLSFDCLDVGALGVDCVGEVKLGAFDGAQGTLKFQLAESGAGQMSFTLHQAPATPLFEAFISADGRYEAINLLAERAELADAFGTTPEDPELEDATVDIFTVLHDSAGIVPQPAKTWCERACEVQAMTMCGVAASAAAACCVASAGTCCVVGTGAAAAACYAGKDCEAACDSQNL